LTSISRVLTSAVETSLTFIWLTRQIWRLPEPIRPIDGMPARTSAHNWLQRSRSKKPSMANNPNLQRFEFDGQQHTPGSYRPQRPMRCRPACVRTQPAAAVPIKEALDGKQPKFAKEIRCRHGYTKNGCVTDSDGYISIAQIRITHHATTLKRAKFRSWRGSVPIPQTVIRQHFSSRFPKLFCLRQR
jgi:hypothetical protein